MSKHETESALVARRLRHLQESADTLTEYAGYGSHAFWLHIDHTELDKASAILDRLIIAMESEPTGVL